MAINYLGIVKSNNYQDIPVNFQSSSNYDVSVTYSLITGTSYTQNLPYSLQLDPVSGYVYNYISHQPSYLRNYNFTVQAIKTVPSNNSITYSTATFNLVIKGPVQRTLQWLTAPALGSLLTGQLSEIKISASQSESISSVRYSIVNGNLPRGLSLSPNGLIIGRAIYGSDGTYSFTVRADDGYENGFIDREFTLDILEDEKSYTNVYFRPFLSLEKRRKYELFTCDEFIFDPKLLYRPEDLNFGVQHNIKMTLEFGVERLNLIDYIDAIKTNFYKRRLSFGNLKIAIAKDTSGTVIYELVYADIVDRLRNIKYSDLVGSTMDTMRRVFTTILLPDQTQISVNSDLKPRFMQTAQPGSYLPPYFMSLIPICYALPGNGQRIINRIKLSNFEFNNLDFTVDRLVVENIKIDGSTKYLLLDPEADIVLNENDTVWSFDDLQTLTETVEEKHLYQDEFIWVFNDGVTLRGK